MLREHLTTFMIAAVVGAVSAGSAAAAAYDALNADKVDNRHAVGAGASNANRRGKLVATDALTGKLPNDIIAKAPDADRLDGVDSAVLQRSYCELWLAEPRTYPSAPCRSSSTVENAQNEDIGNHSSVAIGADGLPIIAHRNIADFALEVTHCGDPACTTAVTTTHENEFLDDIGSYPSLAIGSDGLAIISHRNNTREALQVTHCNNVTCTSASEEYHVNLQSDDIGAYSALAIGTDGLPVISHYNATDGALEVTQCATITCGGNAVHTTHQNAGLDDVGSHSSIAIGTDRLPIISHFNETNATLEVTHCANRACTSASDTTHENGESDQTGLYTSLAIGIDGRAIISHYNSSELTLELTHCTTVACASATATTLQPITTMGAYGSLAIGTDGRALISHLNGSATALMVTHCANTRCTSATHTTHENAQNDAIGFETSIAIGIDGVAIASHRNASDLALEVTHLAVR